MSPRISGAAPARRSRRVASARRARDVGSGPMDLVGPLVRRQLREALEQPDEFWAEAAEELDWFRPWTSVFEEDPPTFRWFGGGETNLAWNALDRHVRDGEGGRAALVAANERGERRVLTYGQLLHEVERTAAALRKLGIRRGDRLTIYMPTCVEAIVAMLATVRIGAIHCVVFAGFGAGALGDRIAASGSRMVLTADVTFRKGKAVALKPIVDDAVTQAEGAEEGTRVERVVVLRRGGDEL